MKQYVVIGTAVTFMSGRLALTEEQYRARRHALRPLGEKPGLYEILHPTQFKLGERLGFDGPVNKLLLELVQEIEEAAASGAPTAEAEETAADAAPAAEEHVEQQPSRRHGRGRGR